jgi:M6 family metalloprotease-like protein/uncharacterized repeat protein (TIGR02543 family)
VTGNGDIISTGVRVGKAKPPGLKAKQRITPAQAMEKGRARRDAAGVDGKGQIKPELREKFLPKNGRSGKPGAKGGGKPATPGSTPESGTQPAPDGSTSQYAPSDATRDPSAAQPAPEQTSAGIAYAPGDPSAIDKRIGLVLLAYFPDRPGDVTRTVADIDAFCNAPNYSAGTLASSVYGYFNMQSNGRVEYTNVVTAWFVANNPRSYYANDNIDSAIGSQALLQEGLNKLQASGFDFTQCDADNNNVIDGVNIMYAGATPSSWTRGLWPHKSADSWSGFAAQGLSTSFQYQITDMPATLPLATFCHENGHMLFDFPDLYAYNGGAANLGTYSLMAGGVTANHPNNIDPYLKISKGWANVVDVTSSSSLRAVVQRDRNHFYRFRNPARTSESFIFEVRHNSGYEGVYGGAAAINPTSGLVVYHAMDGGSNTDSSIFTASNPNFNFGTPYKLMVIEANPSSATTPWYGDPTPGSNDGFSSTGKSSLTDSTFPDLKFWAANGRTVASNAVIRSISAVGDTMSFTVGAAVITAPPQMGVTSNGLAAITHAGANATSQTFSLFNAGSGTFNYSITSSAPWLSVSPATGSVTDAETDTLTVNFSNVASSLAAGTYNGTISLSSPEASNSPMTVAVTLKVDQAWTAPVITVQPLGTHLLGDAPYTLTATATGYPTPQYQWYRNGVQILGLMGNSYTIPSASTADAGTYTVTAFSSAGLVTSENAVITVNDHPYLTKVAPLRDYVSIPAGTGLILQANVTDDGYGGSSLTNTWSVQSTPVGGTVTWDNTNTTSTAAKFSTAGTYQLRFTSSDTVNTRFLDYFVSVGVTPPWVASTNHIVQYPFSETSGTTAVDEVGGNQNGTLVGGASFSNGKLVLNGSTGLLTIPSGTEIDTSGPYAKRTVSLWFKPNAMSVSQMLYEEGGATAGMNMYITSGGFLVFNLWNQNAATNVSSYQTAGYLMGNQIGVWNHVALVLDATTGGATVQANALRIYFNGNLVQSKNGVRLDSHADGIAVGGISGSTRDGVKKTISNTYFFNGEIKDFSLYNRALSASEIVTMVQMSNLGPIVNAGPDLVGRVGMPVVLDATVGDDGLPQPPAAVTTSWAMISGPGSGVFDNAALVDTFFTGAAAGNYVLRLSASDGDISTFDETTINNTIDSGPGVMVFASSTYTSAETVGTLPLTVNRPLGAGITGAVSVSYAAVNGTAINGTDFTLAPGTLTWADQESGPKTINIPITNDVLMEYDETFSVVLSNPTGGAVLTDPFTTTVTIQANDSQAPWFTWDAALNAPSTKTWTSSTANVYDWTFDDGYNKTPPLVSGCRLRNITRAFDFKNAIVSTATVLSATSFDGFGSNAPATFEFVLDTDADDGVIFETGRTTSGVVIDLSAGVLRGTLGGSASVQVTYALSAAEKSNFIHVVLVADQVNNVAQLYVDGSLKDSKSWTTSEDWSDANAAGLGGSNSTLVNGVTNTGNFIGKMALFRFYRAALNAQQVGFTYQDLNPNPLPVFASNPINGGGLVQGVAYNGTLAGTATDAEGETLTYALVSAPTWLSVAPNGTLSGTPGSVHVGVNSFTVSVSDGLNAPVQATLQISVYPAAPTITYNGNGSTSGTAPVDANSPYSSGASVTALGVGSLVKTGHAFTGWNTAADGSGTVYAPSGSFTLLFSTTLYAQWTPSIYTLSFDANGGTSPSPTIKSVTYGSPYGTLATTSRTNYTFKGWFTAASGGSEVIPESAVSATSNHTLYAQWLAGLNPPLVVSFNPVDNATGHSITANLVITYNEPIALDSGLINIRKSSDGSLIESYEVASQPGNLSVSGNTLTINPTSNLEYATGYYVTTSSTAIRDLEGNYSPGITDSSTWNFTTQTSTSGVLFADNFNRSGNTNLNAAITGKSGTLGTLNWTEKTINGAATTIPTVDINNSGLRINNGTGDNGGSVGGFAWVNQNFIGLSQFTVSVDIAASTSGGDGRNSGFSIGQSLAELNARTNAGASPADLHVGWDNYGATTGVVIYKNGSSQGYFGSGLSAPDTLSATFTFANMNAGTTVNYEVFLNGASITTGTTTWSGTNENYINLQSNTTEDTRFDNFQISGVVVPPNSPPLWAFSSFTKSNATEGTPYSATLAGSASDADNNSLTFGKVSGPVWLSVAANGMLSGSPTPSDAGNNSFIVSVSDGIASPVQATLNINVTSVADLVLTYDGNGSTSGTPSVDVSSPYASGATVTVLGAGSLSRSGYIFSGWNTAANGSGTSYAAGSTLTISGNTTLYAKWLPKTTPIVSPWPTATSIISGQALSAATLTGGSASVPGSFSYSTPSVIPPSGSYSAAVTFTPTDTVNFYNVAGNVNVTVQTAFEAWASLSPGTTFSGDSNADGVADGLAWLLGAGNPGANASALLPAAAVSNGNLAVSFQCLNASKRGSSTLSLQYTIDLGITDPWESHTQSVPDSSGTVGGVVFVVTPSGIFNHVQATIPASAAASSGKIFARLRGHAPTP